MDFDYYIGEGEVAASIISKVLDRWEVVKKARKEIMEKYGADSLLVSNWDGTPSALGYKTEQSEPWLRKKETQTSDYYAYGPKRNTRKGKELAHDLEDANLIFNLSEYLIKKLDDNGIRVSRWLSENRRLYRTTATLDKEQTRILLRIPDSASLRRGNDPYPELPHWFRKVKASEYLSAQGN